MYLVSQVLALEPAAETLIVGTLVGGIFGFGWNGAILIAHIAD